jgi:AcrR family transcriptional regulator
LYKIVNVGRWYQELERALAEFAPAADLSDPKERRRRQILDAAKELFIRHGYRKTSIDEVAALAGVAKGTVYVYAKNKADLLVQVIVEEKKRYLTQLKPVLDREQAPRDRLRWWIKTALVVHSEMPLVARLLSGDREIVSLFQDMDPDLRERSAAMQRAVIVGLLEEAARPHRWTPSELEDRAGVLIGLMYASGVFADPHMRGGLSNERFAEVLTETLLEGLLPHDGRGER